MKSLILGLAFACLLAAPAFAGDKDPAASLSFVVVKDYNDKPVRNAGVVMHPVERNGQQSRGGLELKTDSEGKCSFEGVPYGKLRVQVIASGLQTFGQDYDVNQPTMEIRIRLKRPTGQYSVYDDHPEDQKNNPPKPDNKSDQKPQDQKPQ